MRIARHPLTRFILAAVLVVGPVAGTALARGPKSHAFGTSTLELQNLTSPGSAPSWGDEITFDVYTTETDYPFVGVQCYQGDELAYSAFAGFYPSYPWPYAQTMTLKSNVWTGGAADCVANLKYNDGKRVIILKTLNFAVAA